MRAGPACGFEVDGRVADEERLGRRDAGARDEVEKTRGAGLAAVRRVAADRVAEERVHLEALEDPHRRALRLVREHGETTRGAKGADRLDDPRVGTRRIEEPGVVVGQEALECVRRLGIEAGPLEGASHQHCRAFADQARHDIVRKGRGAELGQECVCRLGEIPVGVNERSVEIEDHESNLHSHLSATMGSTLVARRAGT